MDVVKKIRSQLIFPTAGEATVQYSGDAPAAYPTRTYLYVIVYPVNRHPFCDGRVARIVSHIFCS